MESFQSGDIFCYVLRGVSGLKGPNLTVLSVFHGIIEVGSSKFDNSAT